MGRCVLRANPERLLICPGGGAVKGETFIDCAEVKPVLGCFIIDLQIGLMERDNLPFRKPLLKPGNRHREIIGLGLFQEKGRNADDLALFVKDRASAEAFRHGRGHKQELSPGGKVLGPD